MLLAPVALRPAPTDARLDELGRIPLVRFTYDPVRGASARLPRIVHEPVAFPTWDGETGTAYVVQGWDAFWRERPVGAGRLVRTNATGFDGAVQVARAMALRSSPDMYPGLKQAHAVLQAADGAWYVAGLGLPLDTSVGRGVHVQRLGSYYRYQEPQIVALAPEVQAVVGDAEVIDLRCSIRQ